jgi:hypothetical protein
MPEHLLPSGACGCGCRWAWTGNGWIVSDIQGRASLVGVQSGPPAPPAGLLKRCPVCSRLLSLPEAKVEEVIEG